MEVDCVKSNIREASQVLKAISNPRRLMVLCALCDGEKSVGELELIIKISQSALSQHLAILREDNLVNTRRESQTIFYSVSSPAVHELLCCLNSIFSETNQSLK